MINNDNNNRNNKKNSNANLMEFGFKLPSSLPSCVREGRSGSGVGVARHVGIWRPSRSIVFFGDSLPETSPGGSPYAATASKSAQRPVFADSTALFPPRDVFLQTVRHFGHPGWKKCCTVVEFVIRETYFCVDRV